MANGYWNETDELEFELDEQEFESYEADQDLTGTLRSGETPAGWPGNYSSETPEESSEFGQRFFELSLREYESESEVSRELDEILDEMERQYFLGGLVKGIGGLVKKVAKVGAPIVSKLASSALKGGLLKPLAQTALSFVPGGSMAMPLLQGLGFGGGGGGGLGGMLGGLFGGGGGAPQQPQMPAMPDFSGMAQGLAGQFPSPFAQQMPWNNLAQLFQDSFSQLAARTQGEVTDPVQATQLANEAFRAAVQQKQLPLRGGRATVRRGARVITLRPGEELVIKVRS